MPACPNKCMPAFHRSEMPDKNQVTEPNLHSFSRSVGSREVLEHRDDPPRLGVVVSDC
jgi:hypothetical protein